MSEQPKQKKSPFQAVIILLLLVILPAGSYYYLNKGYNYQIDSLKALMDYGQVPNFQFQTRTKTLTQDDLKGKISLLAFLGSDPAINQSLLEHTTALHKQFDEQNDLKFLFYEIDSKAPAVESLSDQLTSLQISDPDQIFILNGDPAMMQGFLKNGIKVPAATHHETGAEIQFQSEGGSVDTYPFLVLADTSLTIRNYYDTQNAPEIARLVEHLAFTIPRKPRADIELRREKEK